MRTESQVEATVTAKALKGAKGLHREVASEQGAQGVRAWGTTGGHGKVLLCTK